MGHRPPLPCPPHLTPIHSTYRGTGGYEGGRYGAGGRGGSQVTDQSFEHSHNNALVVRGHNIVGGASLIILQTSYRLGKPVRVIRGHNLNSKYSPHEGFVVVNSYSGITGSHLLGTAMTAFTR